MCEKIDLNAFTCIVVVPELFGLFQCIMNVFFQHIMIFFMSFLSTEVTEIVLPSLEVRILDSIEICNGSKVKKATKKKKKKKQVYPCIPQFLLYKSGV